MTFRTYTLDDILEVTSSKRIHRKDYVSTGIPFYRGKEIIEKSRGNSISTELFISPKQYKEIQAKHGTPCNGDILLTSVGTLGVPHYIENEGDFYFKDGNITWFRKYKNLAISKFIYYWLISPKTQSKLDEISIGSTQRALTITSLKSLQIQLPSVKTQKKIIEYLDLISNHITLLRETNKTLEAIAQAIFKSWFVDFDPVHAKAEGRTPEGMDDETAALFPEEFEESELGLVPKGWELVPFGKALVKTIGGDWGSEEPTVKNNVEIAIIRGTDIPDLKSGGANRMPIRYTTEKKMLSRRLQAGDIVIEVSGGSKNQPTGRSIFISKELLSRFNNPVVPASFCRLFRPISLPIGTILSEHLRFLYDQGLTWNYQNQSTGISNFQTKHFLKSELVTIPSNQVTQAFFEVVSPILNKTQTQQILKLEEVRDTLLPRLISGKLRLPEAEAIVDEVI